MRNTKYEIRDTSHGFTLIELVVSIGLLAMVLAIAGTIFRVSIDSHRLAVANAEIMQKLRVITSQLDDDFKGARLEQGGVITFGFDLSKIDDKPVEVKADNIVFFANGNFQSTRQYEDKTAAGNVACILYSGLDPNSYDEPNTPIFEVPEPKDKLLVRRQTILTSDFSLPDSTPRGEYYKMSLAEWQSNPPFADPNEWSRKPLIKPDSLTEEDIAMYMAKGVDDFKIQYAPRGAQGKVQWLPVGEVNQDIINPIAFKFTFSLYDSKGIIRNGRTFTHIVYLGN